MIASGSFGAAPIAEAFFQIRTESARQPVAPRWKELAVRGDVDCRFNERKASRLVMPSASLRSNLIGPALWELRSEVTAAIWIAAFNVRFPRRDRGRAILQPEENSITAGAGCRR
jgi:hypothetical protein